MSADPGHPQPPSRAGSRRAPTRWATLAAGPLWRGPLRFVVPGGAVAVAAVATAVVLLVQTSGAACAAPPPRAAAAGKATNYAADGGGNCSFDRVSAPLVVALGPAEYRAGAACGSYLDVTGPKGTVRVKVSDQCPECPAGHLDLSREAFERIGTLSAGIIAVTYGAVADPAVPGPLTVRVKEGSSRYWLAVRLDNHGNALRAVEVRTDGGWQALGRTDYNYWIRESGAGPGPFTLRITDATGRQATVSGVTLSPGTVQRTGVSMYSGAVAAPARSAATSKSPAPSRPASSAATSSAAASPAASPAPSSDPATPTSSTGTLPPAPAGTAPATDEGCAR